MAIEKQQTRMTAADFWQWLDARRAAGDTSRYELASGAIIAMAHPRKINSIIAAFVLRMLGNFIDAQAIPAYVLGADGGYTLGPDDARVPDASVIYMDRIPDLEDRTAVIAPDLAVEVISPSESPHRVSEKTALYLNSGARIVWNVYPDTQSVEVWTQQAQASNIMQVQRLLATNNDVLSAGDVLPGFTLPLRDIFSRVNSEK